LATENEGKKKTLGVLGQWWPVCHGKMWGGRADNRPKRGGTCKGADSKASMKKWGNTCKSSEKGCKTVESRTGEAEKGKSTM